MDFDYSILAKYLTGQISAEELSVIQVWAKGSDQNKRIWKAVQMLRIKENFDHFSSPDQVEKALLAIEEKMKVKKTIPLFRRTWQYAASFLLLISGTLAYLLWNGPTEEYLTYVVDKTQVSKRILLSDSTEVWLRGGTRLQIPTTFSKAERKAVLEGEAYFIVKRDSLSPFMVKAGDSYIKVLGTTFNLKYDTKIREVEATLISGHVIMQNEAEETLVDMSPGDKVTWNTDQKSIELETVDLNLQGLWRYEQFKLEDKTLREICQYIGEVYGMTVHCDSLVLSDQTQYRFVFSQGETVEEVCEHFGYVAPIKYEIKDKEIKVMMLKNR
mgnify:FL=1